MKNSTSTIAKSVKGTKSSKFNLSKNDVPSNVKTLNTDKIEDAQIISMELAIIPKDAPSTDAPKLSNDTLDALNATMISNDLKASADRKTIFKKEFNNKKDRTKCRLAFQNAIGLYLSHIKHDKLDLAKDELEKINSIANHYYVAGNSFKSYSDYASNTMDELKIQMIKTFILVNADLNVIAE
jgi:hypothetical protein